MGAKWWGRTTFWGGWPLSETLSYVFQLSNRAFAVHLSFWSPKKVVGTRCRNTGWSRILTKHVPCSDWAAAHSMPGLTLSSMTREHWKFDNTSTTSFWSVGLGSPMGNDTMPHPRTVPFWPTYEVPAKKAPGRWLVPCSIEVKSRPGFPGPSAPFPHPRLPFKTTTT